VSTFLLALAFTLAGLFIYLLPAFVAWRRGHRQTAAIVVLNVLLGWTAIGWVLALVWACTADLKVRGVAA
jgi:hypothetical protein